MNETRLNLVIYFLQTKTKSFIETYRMAREFLGESNGISKQAVEIFKQPNS